MKRPEVLNLIAARTLRVFVSTCMMAGLLPALALADTTMGVQTEKPAQVSEVVTLGQGAAAAEQGEAVVEDMVQQAAQDRAPEPQNPAQIVTEVVVESGSATETILQDGLAYEVVHTSNTATLTGWYGQAPKGDLSLPQEIVSNGEHFQLTKIWGGVCFLPILNFAR